MLANWATEVGRGLGRITFKKVKLFVEAKWATLGF